VTFCSRGPTSFALRTNDWRSCVFVGLRLEELHTLVDVGFLMHHIGSCGEAVLFGKAEVVPYPLERPVSHFSQLNKACDGLEHQSWLAYLPLVALHHTAAYKRTCWHLYLSYEISGCVCSLSQKASDLQQVKAPCVTLHPLIPFLPKDSRAIPLARGPKCGRTLSSNP